jgi:hypothetical protein
MIAYRRSTAGAELNATQIAGATGDIDVRPEEDMEAEDAVAFAAKLRTETIGGGLSHPQFPDELAGLSTTAIATFRRRRGGRPGPPRVPSLSLKLRGANGQVFGISRPSEARRARPFSLTRCRTCGRPTIQPQDAPPKLTAPDSVGKRLCHSYRNHPHNHRNHVDGGR